MADSPLLSKSKTFALEIIKVCNEVKSTKRESVLTNQLIRPATPSDANTVAALALLLWPYNTLEDLCDEFTALLSSPDAAVFLYTADGKAIGFAQCQLRRDYVEGTSTSPVGYLEGIFVREEYRGRGIAKALLSACEVWAKSMGCGEFASDCELDNDASLRFHLKSGFIEANRIICFTKSI